MTYKPTPSAKRYAAALVAIARKEEREIADFRRAEQERQHERVEQLARTSAMEQQRKQEQSEAFNKIGQRRLDEQEGLESARTHGRAYTVLNVLDDRAGQHWWVAVGPVTVVILEGKIAWCAVNAWRSGEGEAAEPMLLPVNVDRLRGTREKAAGFADQQNWPEKKKQDQSLVASALTPVGANRN